MQECLICGQELRWQPSICELLSFHKIEPPVICNNCQETFVPIGLTKRCQGCGRPRGELCRDCQRWQRTVGFILRNESLYEYNEAMKKYMHTYKFMGDYRLRRVFEKQMARAVQRRPVDLIIPVPVHERTWQTRGFNQVCGLLEAIPLDCGVLTPRQQCKNVPQSAKNREERLQTEQPFQIVHPERICQKEVLLVDDVYTTGRTLYHAATLCRKARCRLVRSITLAS